MTSRKDIQRTAIVLLAVCGITFAALDALLPRVARAADAASKGRPNVVLIMADDQGYGEVACHGNTMIQTPNLDALSKESVRLTNFHVDPTCSPTRSALMTGRYSSRTGVWHTIMGRSLLRKDEVTVADVFKAAGYRTGVFGKWHLGDCYPFRVQDRGFTDSLVHGGGGVTQTPDYWDNDYFDDTYWRNGTPEKQTGYCTDVWFTAAMEFVAENKDRPFFCYIPTNAPHGPFLVAEKYSKPYVDKGVPGSMAAFYGMITNIDENVGRMVAHLKKLGLEENTILIFMTDNGTAAGVSRRPAAGGWNGFNAGMRGTKGSEYDGGHRVPFYIRWPGGKIGGGRDVANLAAHIDVLPTLADLCGIDGPKNVKIDGTSLRPLLEGKTEWPERTLLVHSQRIEHPQKWRKSAVMTDRWRLVNGKELYDMKADPGQKQDVAAANPATVAQLTKAYDAWWDGLSERFDEYCEIELGSPAANPTSFTCHDWHGGNVPWNQRAVRSNPKANGFWAVEVVQAGTYEFTLRGQPAVARYALNEGTARVKVGELEATAPITAGQTSVTVTMQLKAGKTKLQTWLAEEGRGERGAFFVDVKRVD